MFAFSSKLLIALCAIAQLRAETALEIMRKACAHETRNYDLQQLYTYRVSLEQHRIDKHGEKKDFTTKEHDVLWIGGKRYERQLMKDGKPLSDKDARNEQKKMDREIEKRRNESPKERQKRLDERAKEIEDEKEARRQIPEAYDFKLLGEEVLNGRPCYKIFADPKPGYQGKGNAAKLLTKLRGTVWIDKAEYQFAGIDAETLDSLSIGLALIRIKKGARLKMDQSLVNNEVWFPSKVELALNAKALFILGGDFEFSAKFSDFRKFAVDSTVQTGEALEK